MKRLAIIFLLLSACAWAQRTDTGHCGLAGGASLGNNWTIDGSGAGNGCSGQTADTTQASTETIAYGITSGHLYVAYGISCDTESVAGGCSGGPYTAAPLYITDADSHVQSQSTVTVSGSTLTITGGMGISMAGCNWGGCRWAGKTITVAGSSCTLTTPLSLTSATVSGCTAGTGETFLGPTGELVCTDTSDSPGMQNIACWGIAQSTDSGDSFTVHGAASNPPHSMAIEVQGVSNTSGNYSIDAAACIAANCAANMQNLGSAQAASKQQMKLSTTGELVFFGSVMATGPAYVATGWSKLLMGSSGATLSNPDCATGHYCTNQAQVEAESFASSGIISPTTNTSAGDVTLMLGVAFTSTTTAYAQPSNGGFAIANYQCFSSSNTAYCGSGQEPGYPFGMPLTNPSIVIMMEQYSSGTPTTPTFNGGSMTACGGLGAIASGGGSHMRCWYKLNTSNARETTPTFTTYPQWYQLFEITGGNTSTPFCGGSGAGYASHASGTSTTGAQNATSGSVTPNTNGCLIIGGFDFDNGPPGLPMASPQFTWLDPVATAPGMGAVSEWYLQPTAGARNPTATDCNGNAGCSTTGGTGTSGDSYAGITVALNPPSASTGRCLACDLSLWMIPEIFP